MRSDEAKQKLKRRKLIADEIRNRIGVKISGMNFYGEIDGQFWSALSNGMSPDQFLADQEMWRVPFYMIAKAMDNVLPHHRRVIDHAFWLVAYDPKKKIKYEPWGFVTEPYLELSMAKEIKKKLDYSDWGVKIEVLPQEMTAWNPGSTIPIAVYAQCGYLPSFLKHGVGAALKLL